jgi:rhodanese-related sulfurtransferase
MGRAMARVMLFFALFLIVEQVAGEGYRDITAEEAHGMLAGNPSIFLLDVRTTGEYEVDRHIPGAYLIPHTELEARSGDLPVDRDTPVIVYCRSGYRSGLASQDLVDLGYTDVRNMVGGFVGWAGMGYPTLSGPERGTFPIPELSLALVAISLFICKILQGRFMPGVA